MKKTWLLRVHRGLYYLYVGIIINHWKDPYQPTRIQWKVRPFFFVAQMFSMPIGHAITTKPTSLNTKPGNPGPASSETSLTQNSVCSKLSSASTPRQRRRNKKKAHICRKCGMVILMEFIYIYTRIYTRCEWIFCLNRYHIITVSLRCYAFAGKIFSGS